MKTGIIYKATCTKNGKIYIGQTTLGLKKRMLKHLNFAFNKNCKKYNIYFYNALRKYKKDNFKWEVAYDNVPINYLDIMEILTIASYNSYKNGYNSTEGGKTNRGYKHSKETKAKLSKMRLGSKLSKETKQKISKALKGLQVGEKHPMYGKCFSQKTRDNMSLARLGKKHSEKTKQKISESQKGRVFAGSTKQKMSEAKRGEKCYSAKLTWAKVKKIRAEYATGKYLQRELAKKYKVSETTISYIVNNITWT